MNASAANALLKELEEPPANAVLLLVAHQPSALLPTIRSRCRTLRFDPLGPEDLSAALTEAGISLPEGTGATAVTALSGGSVGAAVRLIEQDGAALYADLVSLLGAMPGMDRQAALALADSVGGRAAEDRFDLVLGLIDTALFRVARAGATGAASDAIAPGEEAMLARLAPDPRAARTWAELASTLTARARQGRAVNLDPAALIFDTLLDLDRTAARLAVPAS
jgi:DNA polymerase-3 subunit delta'